MDWLSQNWVFLLVAVAFVALHIFGHGAHGHHGGHRRREQTGRKAAREDETGERPGHPH